MEKLIDRASKKIKAIVFDFDATLMDTEPNWYYAAQRLLSDYGVHFTYEMKKKYIGRSFAYMVKDWIRIFNLPIGYEELAERKIGYYLELARGNTFMFPTMKTLFDKIKNLSLPMAIATGSAYFLVDDILTSMNMRHHFDIILGCDSVEKGKPEPDIFLKAASHLQIDPEHILVFEDSPHGVEAAKAAGMMCVAIPYLVAPELPEIFSRAEVCVAKGMDYLNPGLIFDWIKEGL